MIQLIQRKCLLTVVLVYYKSVCHMLLHAIYSYCLLHQLLNTIVLTAGIFSKLNNLAGYIK
jgi:hypothetical protein